MIVTVTMNPAIDRTIDIGTFVHGGLNRIKRTCMDAGGKGINVSKTIHHLGGETVATGFVAGNAGETIQRVLADYGIPADFVSVSGETRTNTKVVEEGGVVTELNEPGPKVTQEKLEELITKLEGYAAPGTLVVLSGSIPRGVPKDIYGVLTEKMHAKGAAVLLDADGELFACSLYAKPDMIKPNIVELEQYFANGQNGASEARQKPTCGHITELGQRLLDRGIGQVAISMGGDGAVFMKNGCTVRCRALPVQVHSTVGAGDAMVAALAYAWEQGLSFEQAAALGMASSAGAVTTVGTKPPTRELVDELLKKVALERL